MPLDPLHPRAEHRKVVAERHPPGADQSISIEASRLRNERTGVHAKLSIIVNDVVLAWSQFNIERDEDRGRLANKAHKLFAPTLSAAWPPELLKKDVDDFCAGAWEAWLSTHEPEMLNGDPERKGPSLLVEPWIMEGAGTIIFAPPGRGKSYLCLLLAASARHACNQLFSVPRPVPVLYINLERSRDSIRQRIGHINEALEFDRHEPIPVLNARGRSLNDVYDALDRYVRQEKIELVLLDSISRAGYGSLIEDQAVNRIMDALNELGVAWCALAHTPRQDDSHAFGSVHFDAAADLVIKLISHQRGDGRMGVALKLMKANDLSLRQPPAIIGMGFDAYGLTQAWRSSLREFPMLSVKDETDLDDMVVDFLQQIGRASATEIAEELAVPRSRVSELINHDPRFTRAGRNGKLVLWAVKEG